jgi:uncharacterized protein YecT (DUF1311 family)
MSRPPPRNIIADQSGLMYKLYRLDNDLLGFTNKEAILTMRKLLIFLSSLAIAVSATAFAADCGSLNTQTEMNQCAETQFQQLDKELNKVYTEYRSRLNERQKHQIKEAQLAWVIFRDFACAFESSGVEGGSVHPFIYLSCLAAKTNARLKELTSLANCEEGDLSCPIWK